MGGVELLDIHANLIGRISKLGSGLIQVSPLYSNCTDYTIYGRRLHTDNTIGGTRVLKPLLAAAAGCLLIFSAEALTADLSAPSLKVGSELPKLVFTDVGGTEHDMDVYRGDVLLVNFWTSWCPPCIREMPALERLARSMSDKPFRVVMINVNEPPGISQRFGRLANAGIVTLRDSGGGAARAMGVSSYPTSYIIDASGRIREKVPGRKDWDSLEWATRFEALMAEASTLETPK